MNYNVFFRINIFFTVLNRGNLEEFPFVFCTFRFFIQKIVSLIFNIKINKKT